MDDRFTETGGFCEAGCARDDGFEDPFAEVLAYFGDDLLGEAGSAVEHGHDDAEEIEGRVDASVAKLVEQAVNGRDALQRVILALERDQEVIGGGQGIQGEQAEGGRAVQDDDIELAALANGVEQGAEASQAVFKAAQFEFDAAEIHFAGDGGQSLERGRFDPFHGGAVTEQGTIQASAFCFLQSQAAGGVGLRVEIDEEHALAGCGHARGKVD